ncbi:MAG TPA: hypothetical protein DCY36_07015 [Acidimicrobiaceae bacterium]|nr:hypothetical protein [Acidimicrobiaceae bacterium]
MLPRLPSAATQVNERIELVSQRAERHAVRMVELGFNMNFAPVLDVGAGPGIGDRSFSNDASLVTRYGMATIEGLSDGGVLPVAKHFPGHGGADADSHKGRSIAPTLGELRENDLVPFRAAVDSGKTAIMVGHVEIPDLSEGMPASLSSQVIEGLLRGEFNFDGLVVTDALNMQAISQRWSIDEAVVLAVGAGADLMVLGSLSEVEAAFAAVDKAVYEGMVSVERLNDAAVNVLRAKKLNACTLIGRVRGFLNSPYDW